MLSIMDHLNTLGFIDVNISSLISVLKNINYPLEPSEEYTQPTVLKITHNLC